ncbi:MAG: hypothetical protein QM790_15835 [Nibricoccus sp.]
MKTKFRNALYGVALIASFGLGVWFKSQPAAASEHEQTRPNAPLHSATTDEAAGMAPPSGVPLNAYASIDNDLRGAMEQAMKLPSETRLGAMQNVMAIWLRKDRLAAADWMTEKRGLKEFEPLSAQVSDAFFPDDTEMSAMFSFDLSDASLRDVRVNRLVAYWKSGAHLKFDNSPWEVDGPGSASASSPTPVDSISNQPTPNNETAPQG